MSVVIKKRSMSRIPVRGVATISIKASHLRVLTKDVSERVTPCSTVRPALPIVPVNVDFMGGLSTLLNPVSRMCVSQLKS